MLICAMMTSISIVRKETGGLFMYCPVLPVRPLRMITAKMVPRILCRQRQFGRQSAAVCLWR